MAKKKQKSARLKKKSSPKSSLLGHSKNGSVNHWIWIGICLFLTLLAFMPVFSAGFVNWDDGDYSYDNIWIRSFDHFSKFFTTPVQGNYHPLTMITLAFNYAVSGNDAWSYHVLNLLLHLANTGLAYWLAWRLSGDKFWVALVTGLLFGIHPMHVESVAWVSERKDVLYTFFFLLGMLAYLRYIERPALKSYLVVASWFVLSLMSKPAAVVFPVVLLTVDYWLKRPLRFKLITEKIPLFALSLVLGLLTVHAQTLKGATDVNNMFTPSSTFFFGFYSFMMYWIKLIFPINLCPFYAFPPINQALPLAYYLSPLFAAAVGIVLFLTRKKTRLFAFVLAFFLVNIFLVLQFFIVGSAIISDRYAYVPYWSAFFLIGYGMHTLTGVKKVFSKQVALGITGMAALLLTIMSYQQSSIWKNGTTLWEHAIHVCPSSRAYDNRASMYREAKDSKKALEMCNKALEINAIDDAALSIRGNIYFDSKEYEKAIADLSRAIDLNPNNANAYNSRGAAYGALSEFDKALADLKKAAEMNPNIERVYINLGLVHAGKGLYKEAIEDFSQHLLLNPNDSDVWNSLGLAQQNFGDTTKALESFNRAIELNPKQGVFFLNRSRLYFETGDLDKARSDADRAQQLNGQTPQTLSN